MAGFMFGATPEVVLEYSGVNSDIYSLRGTLDRNGEYPGGARELTHLSSLQRLTVPAEGKRRSWGLDQKLDSTAELVGKTRVILDLITMLPKEWESDAVPELENIGILTEYTKALLYWVASPNTEYRFANEQVAKKLLDKLQERIKTRSEYAFALMQQEAAERAKAGDPYAIGLHKFIGHKKSVFDFTEYANKVAKEREEVVDRACARAYARFIKSYGPILEEQGSFDALYGAVLSQGDSRVMQQILGFKNLRNIRAKEMFTQILEAVPYYE